MTLLCTLSENIGWKDNGYIILRGKKVDMPGTYRFWSELNVLLQW